MNFRGLGATLFFSLLGFCWVARGEGFFDDPGDVSGWKTFAESDDWTIKYPHDWRVSTCRHCFGSTEPYAFVTFHDSSASELIVIERLVDRPAGQTVDHWLNEVEEKTVSSPRVREDWMSLHGIRALKVRNRNADSGESENIYILNGVKTFLLRASDIQNPKFYRQYQQMVATFSFRSH